MRDKTGNYGVPASSFDESVDMVLSFEFVKTYPQMQISSSVMERYCSNFNRPNNHSESAQRVTLTGIPNGLHLGGELGLKQDCDKGKMKEVK